MQRPVVLPRKAVLQFVLHWKLDFRQKQAVCSGVVFVCLERNPLCSGIQRSPTVNCRSISEACVLSAFEFEPHFL